MTDPDTVSLNHPPHWQARGVLRTAALAPLIFAPYALLFWISLGSGWSFPRLRPDRLDFASWRHLASDRDGLLTALVASLASSVVVAVLSTLGGILIGRAVRRTGRTALRFLVYLPFVTSPVILGIGLYDFMIRIGLAGTRSGVIALQTTFAMAFASVFFSELWSPQTDRLERLVVNLGGGRLAVWRHAILPRSSGLILICLLQTALYSWLDYGVVSIIGAGRTSAMTLRLFSYLREANVNQAALSGLVLLGPALLSFFTIALIEAAGRRRFLRKGGAS